MAERTIRIPNFDYQTAARQFESYLNNKHITYRRDTMRDGGTQRFTLKDGSVSFLTTGFNRDDGGITVDMQDPQLAGDVLDQLFARYGELRVKKFFDDTDGLTELFGGVSHESLS